MRADILYLPRTATPTKGGWYYARWRSAEQIIPVYVVEREGDMHVRLDGQMKWIAHFDWFGPLPELKEASQ